MIKILFLAANPKDTNPLRLGEEVRAIDDELLKARYRDKFDLEQKHAVKADDLQIHFLKVEPDIVHFSGHGSTKGELFLEDTNGRSSPVSERALTNLFSILKDNIRCVVLNACYSEKQAKAISKNIDCVIGMSKAIGDKAAIKFAQGFYRGIGWGKDLETAFNLGCNQIDIQNLDEQSTPRILWKNNQPVAIKFDKLGESSQHTSDHYGDKIMGDKVLGDKVGVQKIIGGSGITVGGDFKLGDVSGQFAVGENITQTQTISSVDRKELQDSLAKFREEINKLNLSIDEVCVVNGKISEAIIEIKKEKPDFSKIKSKVEGALDTIKQVGDTIETVSKWEWTKKIVKLLGKIGLKILF